MHYLPGLCFSKGNRLFYKGHTLMGGVICRMVDEVKVPTTPYYSYYLGDKKVFVENGTYPFGGIQYYF